MTTATLATGMRTLDTETGRPRRSLEELVDRVFAAMGFGKEIETAEPSATRSACLLYTSPSPRDGLLSRMPSSA